MTGEIVIGLILMFGIFATGVYTGWVAHEEMQQPRMLRDLEGRIIALEKRIQRRMRRAS